VKHMVPDQSTVRCRCSVQARIIASSVPGSRTSRTRRTHRLKETHVPAQSDHLHPQIATTPAKYLINQQ
jgi:hypothetical protein